MTLPDYIGALPSDRVLLQTRSGRWTVSALREAAAGICSVALAGRTIALHLIDPAGALITAMALDGAADALLFISPQADPALVQELAERAGAALILTDRPEVLAEHSTPVPVVTDLASAASIPGAPPEVTRWIMTTSGTTGTPKLVGHTLTSLSRTTRIDPERGAACTWGMVYDYTRFAGMQVLLQAVLSGSCLVVPANEALDARLALFAESGCTHLSATPTLWRKILMSPGADALRLRQITLGGETADDLTLAALAKRFAEARISHIFASTEAGVAFSVTDRRSGFPESYLTNPPAGVELRIVDDRLCIRNAAVARNYIGAGKLADAEGWIDTGDSVEISHGRVHFLGRANGLINVGGDKVHPEEVEHILLEDPRIAQAKVYAKQNPITGALVAADLVLTAPVEDSKALLDELRKHAATRLDRHKVPQFFRIVPELATNAAGKIIRS